MSNRHDTQPLGIVDVGIGNVASIEAACMSIDVPTIRLTSPDQLNGLSRVALPGVGNFGAFMDQLQTSGFAKELKEQVDHPDHHLLGICVGAQALLESSEEAETIKGLGLIHGRNTRISINEATHLPRVGWDYLDFTNTETQINQGAHGSLLNGRYYFSHSFKLAPENPLTIVATSRNSFSIPAIIRSDNVIGVQFHPERSLGWGIRFLGAFYSGGLDAS